MTKVTLKNWGPLADVGMMTGLMTIIEAAAASPLVKSGENGPFMILKGLLDPHFSGLVYTEVFLTWVSFGLIYWHLHNTGRNGCLYYWVDGRMLKEAQPFSSARGYGVWQGFYYAVFWCTVLALFYNLIFAVYAASPGSFPGNSITAWIYASSHYNAVVAKLGSVGGTAYIPALLTWVTRAWLKKMLHAVGVLRLKHWYFETDGEVASSEALEKAAELQSAAFTWTRMWW